MMKQHIAAYVLIATFLGSLIVDVALLAQAFVVSSSLSPITATVSAIRIEHYRATNKISIVEVVKEDRQEKVFQKFGTLSLRWLFQELPKGQDALNYYELGQVDNERGSYAVGMAVSERCSRVKLWLDVFAAYTYSMSFIISVVAVFAAVIGLYGYWDNNLFPPFLNYLFLVYPAVKLVVWALVA